MKTVGHCRFSYFGISDTGRDITDLESAQQLLWNPQRMAVRFHLFENLTLPSIVHQTDPDFTFVLISSPQMPEVYRNRLEALVEGHANIRIHWTDKTHITKASRPIMEEASNGGTDRALHFRVDDDDALAVDFVRRLKEAAQPLEPTSVITFPTGVMGYIEDGIAKHCAFNKFGIAIGYGIVQGPTDFRSPFHIQHRMYARKHFGFMDDSFPAYHYTRHSTNNTSGYSAVIHPGFAAGEVLTTANRRQNINLPVDQVSTTEAEGIIARAFPYTTSDFLRTVIARTMEPDSLLAAP
jgi:Putative rhamnosyl transferase